MTEEKRHQDRYAIEQLVLSVARPGFKSFFQPNPETECRNFSLSGIQFASTQPMKPGEVLVVDLRYFEIDLTEIYCEVVHCQKEKSGLWNSGVKFCFEDKRMQKREISHCLLMIQDKLRSLTNYPTPAL
jgi:hypothetical protein